MEKKELKLDYGDEIDWVSKFKEMANNSDSIVINFCTNLELYIYLTEFFF